MTIWLALFLCSADVEAIATNPGVAKVDQVVPGERLIIHVLDWHFVKKEDFALNEMLSGSELDHEYDKVLAEATAVHKSKLLILADVPELFHEGLTDKTAPILAAEIKVLRKFHQKQKSFDPSLGETTREILEDHRLRVLRMGAAAELKLDGKKIKILPAEGNEHEAARPVNGVIDEKLQAARDSAIVNRIVAKKKTAFLVMGGAHDLAAEIQKNPGWGYVRVTPKGYPE